MPTDWTTLYALNREQEDEFVEYCNLYAPIKRAVTMGTKRGVARKYDFTSPTYANVPCRRRPTPDFENPSMMGQTTEVNIMTEDHFQFHILQPCTTDWMIEWPAGGGGGWWMVQGEPRDLWALGPRVDTETRQIYAKFGAGPTQEYNAGIG